MFTWVLILMLSSPVAGNSEFRVPGFASEQACIEAGNQFIARSQSGLHPKAKCRRELQS